MMMQPCNMEDSCATAVATPVYNKKQNRGPLLFARKNGRFVCNATICEQGYHDPCGTAVCGSKHLSQDNLDNHKLSHLRPAERAEYNKTHFACDTCSFIGHNTNGLRDHKRWRRAFGGCRVPHPCEHCGTMTSSYDALNRHMRRTCKKAPRGVQGGKSPLFFSTALEVKPTTRTTVVEVHSMDGEPAVSISMASPKHRFNIKKWGAAIDNAFKNIKVHHDAHSSAQASATCGNGDASSSDGLSFIPPVTYDECLESIIEEAMAGTPKTATAWSDIPDNDPFLDGTKMSFLII